MQEIDISTLSVNNNINNNINTNTNNNNPNNNNTNNTNTNNTNSKASSSSSNLLDALFSKPQPQQPYPNLTRTPSTSNMAERRNGIFTSNLSVRLRFLVLASASAGR